MAATELSTLHIGNLDQGGGLERYVAELVPRLSGSQGRALGMVLGRGEPAGGFQHFSHPQAPLWERLYGMRKAFLALQGRMAPDGVVVHFPLYALPILDRLDRPLIIHFHGPWWQESLWEGQGRAGAWAKRLIERRVYRRGEHFIVLSQAFGELLQRL
ncbi:MAG: glycosyltransferase family 1 protein, partial [Gammaproteobacteria bacterium]